jgi:hypothetical protein
VRGAGRALHIRTGWAGWPSCPWRLPRAWRGSFTALSHGTCACFSTRRCCPLSLPMLDSSCPTSAPMAERGFGGMGLAGPIPPPWSRTPTFEHLLPTREAIRKTTLWVLSESGQPLRLVTPRPEPPPSDSRLPERIRSGPAALLARPWRWWPGCACWPSTCSPISERVCLLKVASSWSGHAHASCCATALSMAEGRRHSRCLHEGSSALPPPRTATGLVTYGAPAERRSFASARRALNQLPHAITDTRERIGSGPKGTDRGVGVRGSIHLRAGGRARFARYGHEHLPSTGHPPVLCSAWPVV